MTRANQTTDLKHHKPSEKTRGREDLCLLGAHFSIAKGLHNAIYEAHSYGCNALQIFTKNAHTWKERKLSQKEINRFDQAKKLTGITAIASHTSYLINLAANENIKHTLSCKALTDELNRSSILGIPFVVLHPGSHMGSGEYKGIRKIIASINTIFAQTPEVQTKLLLETTAGQG
ncbi:MAG: TIM barrel protein, partial [Desulfobacterales bacterium]